MVARGTLGVSIKEQEQSFLVRRLHLAKGQPIVINKVINKVSNFIIWLELDGTNVRASQPDCNQPGQ